MFQTCVHVFMCKARGVSGVGQLGTVTEEKTVRPSQNCEMMKTPIPLHSPPPSTSAIQLLCYLEVGG